VHKLDCLRAHELEINISKDFKNIEFVLFLNRYISNTLSYNMEQNLMPIDSKLVFLLIYTSNIDITLHLPSYQ
jgi:hypothetical protein